MASIVAATNDAALEKTKTGDPEERVASPLGSGLATRPAWRFSAGYWHRKVGRVSFITGSYTESLAIPDKAADYSRTYPSPAGSGSFANRDYDDGYVYVDDFTDLDGGTTIWGYRQAGQVNGNNLEMNSLIGERGVFSRSREITGGDWHADLGDDNGMVLEASRLVKKTRWLDCGVSLGLSKVSFSESAQMGTFRDSQEWTDSETRLRDTYSLAGSGFVAGGAPVQWSESNPGPVIDNQPSTRKIGTVVVSRGAYEVSNMIEESLDMDLSTLSLGLSLSKRIWRFSVEGNAGPTLNLVETDAAFKETAYESMNSRVPSALSSWSDYSESSDWISGLYVQGGFRLEIIRHLDLGLFGRYDWLDSVSGTVGPSSYQASPEGGSVGGSVSFSF